MTTTKGLIATRVLLQRRLTGKEAGSLYSLGKKRCYHELSHASHGDPSDVLSYRAFDVNDLHPPDSSNVMARVQMLHAPLNPADINSIQGRYPQPDHEQQELLDSLQHSRYADGSTVAGSGGLGIVTHVVGEGSHAKVGEMVTMAGGGLGTFRSSFWSPSSFLIPLERGHELWNALGGQASTLTQLGGTAIRLLKNFCSPKAGDVVLQNAGNSGVGFMVSQLAQIVRQDLRVVSIVRRGQKTQNQWDELVDHLIGNGKCAKVVAEEDLFSSKEALREFQSDLRDMSATNQLPQLGLNAVGGDCASLIQKCLDQGGTMVTYGGMSMRPVTTSTSQLIFRDLRIVGYWHSRWMVQNPPHVRKKMLNELVDAVLDSGVTCPPVEELSLSEFQEALLSNARQSDYAIRKKVVFTCQDDSPYS